MIAPRTVRDHGSNPARALGGVLLVFAPLVVSVIVALLFGVTTGVAVYVALTARITFTYTLTYLQHRHQPTHP